MASEAQLAVWVHAFPRSTRGSWQDTIHCKLESGNIEGLNEDYCRRKERLKQQRHFVSTEQSHKKHGKHGSELLHSLAWRIVEQATLALEPITARLNMFYPSQMSMQRSLRGSSFVLSVSLIPYHHCHPQVKASCKIVI
jgi:hypothetical protein